jgi:outer membrane protein assembly factor BamB
MATLPPTVEPVPSETVVSAPPPGKGVITVIGQHGSEEGEFQSPQGLALDAQGNLYVADTGNRRIQVFDPRGGLLTVIADARFSGPRYVALDEAGHIYVSDSSERVHVFDGTGAPLQSFGQPGPLPSQFSEIAGLAVDTAGDLLVADAGNGRVQKLSLLSGLLFTFGDQGEQAELVARPEGIALDTDGSIYITDAENGRIQKYAPGGTYLRSFSTAVGELRDIALDGQGYMYVSDGETALVHIFDAQGQPLMQVGQGELTDPWGVAVDRSGKIYAADAGYHRVVVLAPPTGVPTAVPAPTVEASPTPTLSPLEGMAAWPMYGGDAQHTGWSPAEGPIDPNVKWIFRVGLLASSPAVGADGVIYFGSLDGNLYALDPDGVELWRAPLGQVSGVPALSAAGTIHMGAASPAEEMFYTLYRDGSIAWSYHLESHIMESSPVVAPDGAVYLATSNPQTGGGSVVALNPDGGERWRYDVGSRLPFSPALGSDGTLYVGARNGNLYALNPDGSLLWQMPLGGVSSSVTVRADGTIYLGTGADYQALNSVDGSQLWSFSPADGEADSTPSLGPGGRIYLTSNNNELYALNPDGTVAWTFVAEEEGEREVHFASPVTIDGALVVYAGTREGELFAINPDGSLRWRFHLPEGGMILVAPALGADGTLYVGAGSNLYAIAQS